MKTYKNIIICALVFFIASCAGNPKAEMEAEVDVHAEEHHDDEVALLPKQLEVMGIQLGKFQEVNLSTTIKSSGQLELPPQNKASLSAILGGRVKDVKVIEGQSVKKGQVLAHLENPEFIQIQTEYLDAKSERTLFEKEFARKKALYKDNITSAKNYEKAEADYSQSNTRLQSAKAHLEMLGINPNTVESKGILPSIPVKSPLEGFVRLVEINIGKYVEPKDEMFEIVDNEHIHIDLMVYEKDIHKVKVDQEVIFSLSSIPEKIFKAKVFAVGKAFENDPKALKVHAEITDHDANVLPGMYVNARIVTDKRMVRAVPNNAIVTESGMSYIFVQETEDAHKHQAEAEDDGHQHDAQGNHIEEEEKLVFKKIEVNTGATDIGFTEVMPAQSIPNDPIIVTKGAFYLLAEMTKGEHSHEH